MKNFQLIATKIDVLPLVHAITQQPELWNVNTLRTTHPGSVHSESDDIWARFNTLTEPGEVLNDKETVTYPARGRLPQIRPIAFDLMRRVEGVRLGRVIITRLPPGKRIAPHIDEGDSPDYYARYQVALQCLPGCLFTIESETVTFQTGDVWWIDNRRLHEVVNNSADDRIVMIVDIRVEP